MMQRRLERSCLRTWQSSRAGWTDGFRRSAHHSGDLHPVRVHRYKVSEGYRSHCINFVSVTDPCMGSGHILVYAFDVFMQIYENAGWSQRDAAQSIIQ